MLAGKVMFSRFAARVTAAATSFAVVISVVTLTQQLSLLSFPSSSFVGGVDAQPPSSKKTSSYYSSNVVALTARNWRSEVEESPHAVFVNICRVG
jgi:hypothetical protein